MTALVAKACDGRVPPRPRDEDVSDAVNAAVRTLEQRDTDAVARYVDAFEAFRPHDALAAVWDTLFAGNELVTRVAPWRLARDAADRQTLNRTLWAIVRVLARQAVLLGPVLPAKTDELWRALGGPGSVHDCRLTDLDALDPAGWCVKSGVGVVSARLTHWDSSKREDAEFAGASRSRRTQNARWNQRKETPPVRHECRTRVSPFFNVPA